MEGLPSDITAISIQEVWDRADELMRNLTDKELARFRSFRFEKRKRDWLAGRMAAKRAIQQVVGLPFRRIEILRTEEGKKRGFPRVLIDSIETFKGFVSISHSGDVAAACFSDAEVGLDIEVCTERDPSFLELVFSKEELADFSSLEEPLRSEAVTRAWCKKEALAKGLGVGLSVPFQSLRAMPEYNWNVEDGLFVHDRMMAWARVRKAGR